MRKAGAIAPAFRLRSVADPEDRTTSSLCCLGGDRSILAVGFAKRFHHADFFRGEVGERRAHRAGIEAHDPDAGLDCRDCIALLAVTDIHEWVEEVDQDLVGGLPVAGTQRLVEVLGKARHEVEDGRRIGRHTGAR